MGKGYSQFVGQEILRITQLSKAITKNKSYILQTTIKIKSVLYLPSYVLPTIIMFFKRLKKVINVLTLSACFTLNFSKTTKGILWKQVVCKYISDWYENLGVSS